MLETVRSNKDKSVHWGTPKNIADKVREFFSDQVLLDPCSNAYSIVEHDRCFVLPENGLEKNWKEVAECAYVNPPYGKGIDKWLEKCALMENTIALVPVATNTGHWKNWVYGKASAICFLHEPRLKFLENGAPSKKGAPMSCCLIYWGKDREKFTQLFSEMGTCFAQI